MRNSRILALTRAGKPAPLAMLGHFLPEFVAYAAHAGYVGIWLDLEHQPMDQREVQTLLAVSHRYDIDIFVRPPTREKACLYRYLEDGAAGLMVPHVSTPEEARDLVRKVKYPPLGDRGVAGFGLEVNYGLDITSVHELVAHAQRETFLFVQIETPEGLANVDAIAAIEGIDGLYIGPADMSIRMVHEPEANRLPFEQTLQRVAAAASAHGKPWGSFATAIEHIAAQHTLGAQLLMHGIDFLLLRQGLAACGDAIKTVIES